MNIILKPFNCCPECYSTDFKRDFRRSETYCSECGLVLVNKIPFTITEHIRQKEQEQEQLKKLKQHKQLKYIIESYEYERLKEK